MKVGSRRFGAALIAASLLFAGCSDGTGPGEPFDPSQAEADLTTLGELFDNEQLAQLRVLSRYFGLDEGGAPVAAISSARALLESRSTSPATARRMANAAATALSLSRTDDARPSFQALPGEVLGTTFVFDTATDTYVESDRTGAPANGVRFIVYAVNPINDSIQVDTEVGYADLIDLSPNSQTSVGLKLLLVSGGTTYLDYSFNAAPTGTNSVALGVNGFMSDGTTRLNFDVDLSIALDDESDLSALDINFTFSVPSHSFSTTGSFDVTDALSSELLEIDLTVNSGGTKIRYDIVEDGGTGTINATIYVNNSIFATITGDSNDPVIAGAAGAELTAEEESALYGLMEIAYASFFFFLQVMEPAGNALGASFLPSF